MALSTAAHNKPSLIKGLLPELLPLLYDQTVVKVLFYTFCNYCLHYLKKLWLVVEDTSCIIGGTVFALFFCSCVFYMRWDQNPQTVSNVLEHTISLD